MPRRRELNGVAAGFLQKFVSRNNCIDGYWALGIFYKIASDSHVDNFRLNLFEGNSEPKCTYSQTLSQAYIADILHRIEQRGFSREQLCDAFVELRFDVEPTPKQMTAWKTWGDPFLSRLSLVDDLGKIRSYAVRGWCGVHDPSRERQNIHPNSRGW